MSLLDGLNPPQIEAVTTGPGPVLVLAGPGSGKTRVLTHRVAYLIRERGIAPYHILAVTFTNKAAREMYTRIERLLQGRLSGLRIGTFHATCAYILRREADFMPLTADYVIFDTTDQTAAVKTAMEALGIDTKRYRPRTMLNKISAAKNELIGPAEYQPGSYIDEIAGRVYARYQALLEESNAMDFDDLLMRTVWLFQEHPHVLQQHRERYRWVLVDEFQDTNTAQYVLVRQLAGAEGHRNLFVVGDEDQSIYLFRGADYRNVRRFEEDFPNRTKILLEQNYRSTQVILDAANAIITHNRDRTPKQLFTKRQGGVRLALHEAFDENDEARHIARTAHRLIQEHGCRPNDIAVMYRTNAQSRALEQAFGDAHLPFRLVGATRFFARREVKDLLAYLRVIYNPDDRFSLMRVINTPSRGIGSKTLARLEQWAETIGEPPGVALLALADGAPADAPFPARAARVLREFSVQLAGWQRYLLNDPGVTPARLLGKVIEDIDYRAHLYGGGATPVEARSRWENVQELVNAVSELGHADLGAFLEDIALVSDTDTRDEDEDKISLMTLHAAKGLEFGAVFIAGLEEGMLPHSLSFEDPDAMAEERRLMYVGLTRAKDRLYLSYTFRRTRWGETEENVPSRFLQNIPAELFAPGAPQTVVQARHQSSYTHATTWEEKSPQPEQAAQFKSGERVRHAKFGEGIVVSTKLTKGDEMVSVVFDDKNVGIKNLMARFAKLEKLGG